MKNHFVVWGAKYEYNKYCYRDLASSNNCEYIDSDLTSKSKLTNLLFRIHTSKRINDIVKLPLRNKWFKQLCNFDKNNCENLCFIFLPSTKHFYALEYGFGEYLRKTYPCCKLICYYDDLVSSYSKNVSIDFVMKTFDFVLSFDKNDCQEYGLVYQPLVYSKMDLKNRKNPNYDICFVGRTKNRLGTILDCYSYLTEKGIRCDFHIVGKVSKSIKDSYPNIHFCDKVLYSENLKIVLNSNVILEVMQKGGTGYTLRTCEAIAFGKKMLTNNKEISKESFYTGNICFFDNVKKIDIDFIKNGCANYSKQDIESISPFSMIKKIEMLMYGNYNE